ncbi:MAG: 50S ribosomal protein L25 [Actinomycetia bacterium]|nr:50S ribosomal protein L25 [Actinomycetes bacterium]
MSETKLVAQLRSTTGSPAARRLRAEGHIPGVLYGQGMSPLSVTVERRELRLALSGPAGSNTVLALQVDGKSYPAVVKEMQRHPIKRAVSHIDFLQVNMNEEITVSVPLHLVGEAKAVIAEGGLVDKAVDHIEVSCTPTDMPNSFDVDISHMHPHDVIRLSDLTMPKGVTPLGDPEMPIVTVLVTSAAEAAATEAAPAADAAGDAAAGGAEAPNSSE